MEKILYGVAKQWIAGETIDDALESVRDAYKKGRHAIVNKLGEYHTSKPLIIKTVKEYFGLSSGKKPITQELTYFLAEPS